MRIVTKYKGMSGQDLLKLVTDDGSTVNIAGDQTVLMPCTLPFANQAEISSVDEAELVAVKTRWMDRDILVRVS